MKHTITKLTAVETENLVSDFLKSIGKRLRQKRVVKNISQTELANCLNIDQSTLSKYENGDRDMQISLLPQFSTYCKFPLYELFPKEESKLILDSFSRAVTITVNRKKRQIEKNCFKKSNVIEIEHKKGATSLREQYKGVEIEAECGPYTETEFYDFVKNQDPSLAGSIISAGQFLNYLDAFPHKDTLKGLVADFIVDELVINVVTNNGSDEMGRRVYAYHKKIYDLKMNR